MADSLHKFEQAPFEERPKRDAIFRNEEYSHVWGDLQDALMRYTGVLVLTGEEGSGRSTILEDMVDQYPMGNLRVFWQSAADFQKEGVAENLARALGVRPGSKEPADIYSAVLDELDQIWSQRKCVVLVISQADLLGLGGLQDLQSLLNFRHSHIEGLQV